MKTKKNNLENIVDLRDQLRETTSQVRDGKIGAQVASVIFNGCGKIISSAKLQIEYNKMIQSKERISFLESK